MYDVDIDIDVIGTADPEPMPAWSGEVFPAPVRYSGG